MDFYKLQQLAEEQGLLMGACSAKRWERLIPILEKKNKALAGFCEQDIEKRVDPKLFLMEADTILLFLLPYGKQYLFSFDGAFRGQLSMSAVGRDYHNILQEALSNFIIQVQKEQPQIKYRSFVDTGPFVEREAALEAGLGYLGKNGALISPKLGGMVCIGGIATNQSFLLPAAKSTDTCGNCELCFRACPGKAFGEDGFFRPEKCISYFTQTKAVLSQEEMQRMGRRLYGCDTCQLVCPKNRGTEKEKITEIEMAMPLLAPFLSMSNKEFLRSYQKTAIGWRGRNILRRNALIALGNYQKKEAAERIIPFLRDENPMIKRTAKQALLLCRRHTKWGIGIPEDYEEAP